MNDKEFSFLGITKWHNAGYYGEGIVIASRENLSEHGTKVIDIIMQICPKAKILHKQEYTKLLLPYIDIYTTSYFSASDAFSKNKSKALELYKEGTFLCCAVGNEGSADHTNLSEQPYWCSIGACDLVKGKPKRMYYSSITEHLDYMSLTNLQTKLGIFTGTSCATPVFASMLVLVQEFFKQKCGRKLTNAELLDFIQDNTIDIDVEGYDTKTGNGVFILPNPENIDVTKYIDGDTIIELTIGDDTALVNNKVVKLDTKPLIYCDRTLVPIRFISEVFNCNVYWDEKRQKVFIIK